MSEKSTVLICRGPHPRGEKDPRFKGRIHGVRLQTVPFQARPTYREVDSWSDAAPGCLAVHCTRCGAFTEYAIAQPTDRTGRERGRPPRRQREEQELDSPRWAGSPDARSAPGREGG